VNEEVTIIGTLNSELFLSGIDRLPEWGKQVHAKGIRRVAAGSGPRVAFPLALLGTGSYLVGKVGRDEYGQEILKSLKDHGISSGGIEIADTSETGMCVILTRGDGARAFTAFLGSVGETDEQLIMNHFDLIKKTRYMLITGYFNLPGIDFGGWKRLLDRACSEEKHILLDTGWDVGNWSDATKGEILQLLPMVTTFLPNREEAGALSEKSEPEYMIRFFLDAGAREVIIKLDRDGSIGYSPEEGIVEKKPLDVNVYDTTAAGEAFNAGILLGLINKWSLEKRLACGNALAGLFISSPDGTYPSLKELEQHMEE